jgi:hypothetical protein
MIDAVDIVAAIRNPQNANAPIFSEGVKVRLPYSIVRIGEKRSG